MNTSAGIEVAIAVYSKQAYRSGGGLIDKLNLCPEFTDPQAQERTNSKEKTGDFTLRVDSSLAVYDAIFCSGEHSPQAVQNNSNKQDAPLSRNPVLMPPR
jgi:hypothetical protein